MQRLLIALMAIGSLLMSNPATLRAQDDGKAVDPASGPHVIDEPAVPPHAVPALHRGSAENPLVHNLTGTSPTALPGDAAEFPSAHSAVLLSGPQDMRKRHSWFGSQLALLILGLLGAGLAVIATPKAAKRVADHVSSNSSRDLIVGGLVGMGMLAILVVNAILLKLPLIKMLWAPVGIMVAFAPLLILGFGWLAAMRCAGDYVARRLNHSGDGSTFGRMSLGLFAFFFLNVLLGSMSRGLGVVGLCTEIAVALMGLGAIVVIAAGSGFGRRA